MARAFAGKPGPGDLLEFALDAVDEFIACSFIAVGPATEHGRDLFMLFGHDFRAGVPPLFGLDGSV